MEVNEITKAVASVYKMAHNGRFRYGDSKTLPPCADGIISCDRLIARALYDLGFKDQPNGGITVCNMERYLTKWGFQKVTRMSDLRAGDIVLMDSGHGGTADASWHTFYVSSFNRSTLNVTKYDCGSQARIQSKQPIYTKLLEWGAAKNFYCAFRVPESEEPTKYHLNWKTVKMNETSVYAYVATNLLKGRGCHGCYKDGKLQNLELNFTWTKGDAAAVYEYCALRAQNGKRIACDGTMTVAIWNDLTGNMTDAQVVDLNHHNTEFNNSVFLAQTLLRGRGIKGTDGKALTLDGIGGDNTGHAVKQYKKARNLKEDTTATYDFWKDILGGI